MPRRSVTVLLAVAVALSLVATVASWRHSQASSQALGRLALACIAGALLVDYRR